MAHAVCYYHMVSATKLRQPLLTDAVEAIVLAAIREKSTELNAPIHAINGAWDHIHVAVSLPTTLSIMDWVRPVKGISSFRVNRDLRLLDDRFKWQTGYSVHTFGAKKLPYVVHYIDNQKIHHQKDDTNDYLEYIPDDD